MLLHIAQCIAFSVFWHRSALCENKRRRMSRKSDMPSTLSTDTGAHCWSCQNFEGLSAVFWSGTFSRAALIVDYAAECSGDNGKLPKRIWRMCLHISFFPYSSPREWVMHDMRAAYSDPQREQHGNSQRSDTKRPVSHAYARNIRSSDKNMCKQPQLLHDWPERLFMVYMPEHW